MLTFPYIVIVGKILTNKNLSHFEKLVLGLLNTRMDIDRLVCISCQEICDIFDVKQKDSIETIESLAKKNFINANMVHINNDTMIEIIVNI